MKRVWGPMPGAICLLTTSRKEAVPARVACADSMSIYEFIDSSITMSSRPGRTTPFTCRVACKEHDVSKNRNLAFSVTCASPRPRCRPKLSRTPPKSKMRFDTQQLRFYCGIDLHARTNSERGDVALVDLCFPALPAFFVGEGSGG